MFVLFLMHFINFIIGDGWGTRKSCRRYNNHWPSQVACAKALYSASKDDPETIVCFLLFQLVRDFTRKNQKPVVDLLVSGKAPQSESENPLRVKEEEVLKKRPLPGLFLRNLRACRAADIWSVLGAARNWLSLLTA